MKKGFTLIELLAVIVILAVIALIAAPTVLNIIEDSKKSSAESSARNILRSSETYYMSKLSNNESIDIIDLSTDTLIYNGKQASKGYIIFENAKASGKMYINGYCIEGNISSLTSNKVDIDKCDTSIENGPYIKYSNGHELLFDPVNNIKCETSIGSTTGTNDGCMKWYVFLDSSYNNKVKLILDHNTTGLLEYNSANTIINDAKTRLETDIINWDLNVKDTARLISATEINEITNKSNWNINDMNSGYYLHTLSNSPYQGENNKYYWLFDNTYNCLTYGCKNIDDNTNGYWTSDGNNEFAWSIAFVGDLGGSVGDFGIRPVIEVDKSKFE